MTCERLVSKRVSESFLVCRNGIDFVAPVSRLSDRRLAEIFLSNSKIGFDTGRASRDFVLVRDAWVIALAPNLVLSADEAARRRGAA
jgi:hypothetical protein